MPSFAFCNKTRAFVLLGLAFLAIQQQTKAQTAYGSVSNTAFRLVNNYVSVSPAASIRTCTSAAAKQTGIACTPTQTVYSDKARTIAKTIPFFADNLGNYNFYTNVCVQVQITDVVTGSLYEMDDVCPQPDPANIAGVPNMVMATDPTGAAVDPAGLRYLVPLDIPVLPSSQISGLPAALNSIGGVPLCTGFTPTNTQYLQYVTTSSPNPCYTSATIAVPAAGGPFLNDIPSPPLLSNFTWVNQIGTTAATQTQSKAISMKISDQSTPNVEMLVQTPPATPWKVRMTLRAGLANNSFNQISQQSAGVYARAANGKFYAMEEWSEASNTANFYVESFTSVSGGAFANLININVGGGTQVSVNSQLAPFGNTVVWQVRDDGTSLYFDYSLDGENFFNVYSVAFAGFLGGSITQVGFGGMSNCSSSGCYTIVSLIGWKVDTNATL